MSIIRAGQGDIVRQFHLTLNVQKFDCEKYHIDKTLIEHLLLYGILNLAGKINQRVELNK